MISRRNELKFHEVSEKSTAGIISCFVCFGAQNKSFIDYLIIF